MPTVQRSSKLNALYSISRKFNELELLRESHRGSVKLSKLSVLQGTPGKCSKFKGILGTLNKFQESLANISEVKQASEKLSELQFSSAIFR